MENQRDSLLLTKDQIDVLKRAEQEGYQVSALTGNVDEITRTVVLLGELHVKDEQTHKLGKEVLSLFPLRGLELVFTDNPLALAGLVPVCCLMFLLYKIASLAGLDHPSTITTALSEADLEKPDGSLVFKKPSKEGDPEENHAPNNVTNIHLEAGSGGFATFAGASMLAGGMASPFYFPFVVMGGINILRNNYTALSATTTLAGGYLMLQMAGLYPITAKQIYGVELEQFTPPLVFPLFYYLLEYRNQIMSRNIYNLFLQRGDEVVMLAIMGKAHIDGITKILTKKFNFEETPLPAG